MACAQIFKELGPELESGEFGILSLMCLCQVLQLRFLASDAGMNTAGARPKVSGLG